MTPTPETAPAKSADGSLNGPMTDGPLKYTKYGIAFGLVTMMVGVVATLLYGYRPAPVRIMKPSFFETPDQIGAVALKRFYVPLAKEKIVVLGLPTNRDWAAPIATGFMIAASQNSRKFTRVIIDDKMPVETRDQIRAVAPNLIELNTNTGTLAELTDALNAGLAANELILVIVPNLYSTHLLPGNAISRLEQIMATGGVADGVPKDAASVGSSASLFSLTVGPLALEASQEKELDPICMGSERDGSGTADLGCAIAQAGRYFYRKRILDKEPNARDRFTAIMQSPKANDFLLLVRQPQNFGKKL